jgi:hypothetical protein
MTTSPATADKTAAFPTVSLTMFVFLSIVTLGLYHIYWFYRAWRVVARRSGERIYPIVRVVLGIFYLRRLFVEIERAAVEAGVEPFSGQQLAGAYLLVMFISRLSGSIALLGLLAQTAMLARLQSKINAMNITSIEVSDEQLAAA